MANQVRIEYDPYHTQIFYNWRTDAEREWGQLTNSILTEQEVYQKSSLQSILPEVIARIDENYNRNKCEPLEIVSAGRMKIMRISGKFSQHTIASTKTSYGLF